MNFMRETEQYYDWLYKIVCGEWEPRNLSFHRLLMYLFNRDYIPACEMDVCSTHKGGVKVLSASAGGHASCPLSLLFLHRTKQRFREWNFFAK